jgi:hypothetical protein
MKNVKILWNGLKHDLEDLYRTSKDDSLGVIIAFEKPEESAGGLL